MNASKMKNMVILKDLPSNIVEEAYVILKPNIKLEKKIENINESSKETSDYIIKEAEMVVSNYLSNIENTRNIRNLEVDKIKKKYDKLKKVCIGLGIIFFVNLLVQIKF